MKLRSRSAIIAACLLFGVGASCAEKGKADGSTHKTISQPQGSGSSARLGAHVVVPKSLTGFADALNSGDMDSAASTILRFESAPWRGEEVRAIRSLVRELPPDRQQALSKAIEGITKVNDKVLLSRLVLVDIYLSLGQPARAAEPLSRIISLSKGDRGVLGELESALYLAPSREGVAALRKQVDAPVDVARSSEEHARRGERDAALADARTVLKRWPRNDFALCIVSRVFQQFDQKSDLIASDELLLGTPLSPKDGSDYYSLGGLYVEAGRPTDALRALRKAISLTKTDSMKQESFRGIIGVYVRLRRYGDAAAAVIESDRTISDRLYALQVGSAAQMDKRDEQALASALESALRGKAGLPASRYLLGHLYLKAERIPEARDAFTAAAREANGDPTILAWIADECRGVEPLRDLALQFGTTAAALHPDDKHAAMSSAQAYLDSGRKAEAIAAAKWIIGRWPDETSLLRGAAGILKATQQWDDAIFAQRRVIATSKDAGVTNQCDLGETYRKGIDATNQYDLGEIYREVGRYSEAVAAYRQAVADRPEDCMARVRLWEIASLQGPSDSAAIEAQTIIDADKGKINRVLLQMILVDIANNAKSQDPTRLAHYRGVADALAVPLRQEPDRVDSRLMLAALYEATRRADDARSITEKALSRATDISLLSLFAAVCGNSGDRAPAVTIDERVVELVPRSYNARFRLGCDLVSAGMKERAAEQAASMVLDWPQDPWAIFYAGGVYLSAGRADDAVEVFGKSMAADDEVARTTGKPVERVKWSCLLSLAGIYEERKDFARERQILDEMLSIAKDQASKQYAQGRIEALKDK